jgi:hypothetical protein
MKVNVVWTTSDGRPVDLEAIEGTLTIEVCGSIYRLVSEEVRLTIDTPLNTLEYRGRLGLADVRSGDGVQVL